MKKQIFIIAAIIILSTTTAIYAQTNAIKLNIPFAFSVNNKTLQAGEYVIRNIDSYGQGLVWTVSSNDKRATLIAKINESADRTGKAKVTFHRYGDQYFLSSFQTLSSKIALSPSRAERNLQRESEERLAKVEKPEIVVIESTIE